MSAVILLMRPRADDIFSLFSIACYISRFADATPIDEHFLALRCILYAITQFISPRCRRDCRHYDYDDIQGRAVYRRRRLLQPRAGALARQQSTTPPRRISRLHSTYIAPAVAVVSAALQPHMALRRHCIFSSMMPLCGTLSHARSRSIPFDG